MRGGKKKKKPANLARSDTGGSISRQHQNKYKNCTPCAQAS